MALACKNPSFIFVHVYKCAGMSVRTWLQDNFDTYEVGEQHSSFLEVRDLYQQQKKMKAFKKAFKFSFVRNPFDWVISLYYFIRTTPSHPHNRQVNKLTFPEFCEWINFKVRNNIKTSNGTYYTLTEFLYDRDWNLIPQYVGRLENFSDNINEIKARLSVPGPCPHINITSEREKNYMSYYNDSTKKVITDLFEFDFKLFDYDFT